MRALLLLLAVAACGQRMPVVLERFPIPAEATSVDHVDREGEASVERYREVCRLELPNVTCVQRQLGSADPPSSSDMRVDDAGLWNVGGSFDAESRYRFTPPYLIIPADAAPGREWSDNYTMEFLGGDLSGQKRQMTREARVASSSRCEGGLLLKVTRSDDTGQRSESELLYCEGRNSPVETNMATFRDGKLVRKMTSTYE